MEERRDNENNKKIGFKDRGERAVVVAQLVEQSLATRGARGSNPVIGKKFIEQSLLSTVLKRQKERRKKKKARNGPFFKKRGKRKKKAYRKMGDKGYLSMKENEKKR